MKNKLIAVFASIALLSSFHSFAQPTTNMSDASAKPIASPRDSVVGTIASGATITITYGSPGIKGRTIGKELEPREDSIWRAGANEATTIEVNRDVMVGGKKLPAGKYALFTKMHGGEWTFIFNKVWQTWGAYSYKENMGQDVLQATAKQSAGKAYNERLKYVINNDGRIQLLWGNIDVAFTVK